MSRLLLLIAVAVVVYLLIKSFRRRTGKGNVSAKTEDMVRCAYCGTHLPKGESIMSNGYGYCSEAHQRAHADQAK